MSVRTEFEALAQDLGMRMDEQANMVYGSSRGISYCIWKDSSSANVRAAVSVQHDGQPPVEQDIKSFVKGCKLVAAAEVEGNRIVFTVNTGATFKGTMQKAREAIEEIGTYLSTNGYTNCCEQCSTTDMVSTYIIGEDGHHLCSGCFDSIEQAFSNNKLVQSKRKNNLVAGIVGALLGSLIGVAAIVIIGQLGYVAALSGVVMGVCALKGYELLGGKLTTPGIIISCIIMLGMVYMGNAVDWAIFISAELDTTIFESLSIIPMLLADEMIEASSFYGNLGMLYLFTVLGAFPTIRASLRSKDGGYEARRAA